MYSGSVKAEPKLLWTVLMLVAIIAIVPCAAQAAAITEHDSTQPRGAPTDVFNDQGQPLDPVNEGFRAPAYWAGNQPELYRDWVGMMMANSMRDPAYFATLSVANQDQIDLINSIPGEPDNLSTPLGAFLVAHKLEKDIYYNETTEKLEPEELLPVAADLCLRCHTPVGWMEGHSEPSTSYFPFLKGQFWGAEFLQNPVDDLENPRIVDLSVESEAEMEGIQCDFCHRARDNYKRLSLFDSSRMANGNGGFFVDLNDPFTDEVFPAYNIQGRSVFCGTCHDVTNPIIKTETKVNGVKPDMLHPIERTYTEWYWSDYGNRRSCQSCHSPMKFPGAQSWMIYPAMDTLWKGVDQVWEGPPYNYNVPNRTTAYMDAVSRNLDFMKRDAADVHFVNPPTRAGAGDTVTVNVKVTNKAGHKLPTGFAEGRQMWIHIKAVDTNTKEVVFENGTLDANGYLVRTNETKVYEQVVMAGKPVVVDGKTCYEGYPFLDKNGDGCVDKDESHFHFVLMNYIKKDNRIPPKGYIKDAYTADGAFIVPYDPKDTDYADGQNWDVTPYTFTVPPGIRGKIMVTATLKYQTFNREYIEFMDTHDIEATEECGGRARNLSGPYSGNCDIDTWGKAMYDLWDKAQMGPPVEMASANIGIDIGGPGGP